MFVAMFASECMGGGEHPTTVRSETSPVFFVARNDWDSGKQPAAGVQINGREIIAFSGIPVRNVRRKQG